MFLSPFALGGMVVIGLTDRTVTKFTLNEPATASYRIDSDGNVYSHNDELEDWITNAGLVGNYEVRATKVSGDVATPTSGSLGVWQVLSTDREWTLSADRNYLSCVLFLEIRDAGSLVVQDSATISMSAESEYFERYFGIQP